MYQEWVLEKLLNPLLLIMVEWLLLEGLYLKTGSELDL